MVKIMSEEERRSLEERIQVLQDSIDDIDIKLTEANQRFRNIHSKVQAYQDTYQDLKSFVDKNNPDAITFFDENDLRNETLSSAISKTNNKQLHDLKADLEKKRLAYEKSLKYEEKSEQDLIKQKQVEYRKKRTTKDYSNPYATLAKKESLRAARMDEIRKGRKFYIPLAVVGFIAGCTASFGIGIVVAAGAIGAVVVTRAIQNKNILRHLTTTDVSRMTEREARLYHIQELKESYQTAKSYSKKNGQARLQNEMLQTSQKTENMMQKRQLDHHVYEKTEKDYKKAVQKYNTYLELCQNKQMDMNEAKDNLDRVKPIEDDIVEMIDKLTEVKERKQKEIEEKKQKLSGKQPNDSKKQDSTLSNNSGHKR